MRAIILYACLISIPVLWGMRKLLGLGMCILFLYVWNTSLSDFREEPKKPTDKLRPFYVESGEQAVIHAIGFDNDVTSGYFALRQLYHQNRREINEWSDTYSKCTTKEQKDRISKRVDELQDRSDKITKLQEEIIDCSQLALFIDYLRSIGFTVDAQYMAEREKELTSRLKYLEK